MNRFISYIKHSFRMLTPLEMATKELVEAQRSELEAQSAVEFSNSIVTYNRQRVSRLRAYIAKETMV
jgi:hypothetical protein